MPPPSWSRWPPTRPGSNPERLTVAAQQGTPRNSTTTPGGTHGDAPEQRPVPGESVRPVASGPGDPVGRPGRYFFEGFELASCPRACVASDQARAQANVGGLIRPTGRWAIWLARVDPLGSSPETHPTLGPARPSGWKESLWTKSSTPEAWRGAIAGLAGGHPVVSSGRPTASPSAWNTCTSRTPRSAGGSRSGWSRSRNRSRLRSRPGSCRSLRSSIDAELFETFLQTRYLGQKRFSLEGAETLIPALQAFVGLAAALGVETVVIGMPHRGRLNVLANILDKSYQSIFASSRTWSRPTARAATVTSSTTKDTPPEMRTASS